MGAFIPEKQKKQRKWHFYMHIRIRKVEKHMGRQQQPAAVNRSVTFNRSTIGSDTLRVVFIFLVLITHATKMSHK